MTKTFFACVLFVMSLNIVTAQNEIWLNDGTLINTQQYKVDETSVIYKNKKGKAKILDKQSIFAIVNAKNDTIYFLTHDSLTAQMSERELFDFIKGVHDGYSYNNGGILASSTTIGFMSGLFMPLFGFSPLEVPVPNTVLVFASGLSKDKINLENKSEYYVKGYNVSAKKKKVINAVEGSVAGLTLGTIAAYLIIR